jgi:D-3-phosphoglycerate dehydrogenase / 2-oxoglutarate reductase
MLKRDPYIIIDFDSTFVKVEALDELSKIALENNPKKDVIVKEIEYITNLGMEGKITFPESLSRRLNLFHSNKQDITKLIDLLKNNISESILKNKQFFINNSERIYIISGGFIDYIYPVVKDFGFHSSHILAIEFLYDAEGNVTGFNKNSLLTQENGKVKQVRALGLDGEVWVIGDGYTDYQIKEANLADKFFVFTENIRRDALIEKAQHSISDFSSIINHTN